MNFDHIKKCKVVLVSDDKGQKGVYVDGDLILRGKRINILDILKTLQITHSTIYYSSNQMKHMGDKFPNNIKKLYKKDKEDKDESEQTKH